MSYCALLKQSLFHYVRIKILLLLLLMYIGEVPSSIFFLFRANITYHEHNTRSTICLHTPISRNEATYQTFSYRGAHNYLKLHISKSKY